MMETGGPGSSPLGLTPRVLVVCRDRSAAEAITTALTQRGYPAEHVQDAGEAGRALRRRRFEVLLVDIPEAAGHRGVSWERLAEEGRVPAVVLVPATWSTPPPASRQSGLLLRKPVAWGRVLQAVAALMAAGGPAQTPPRGATHPPLASPARGLSPREQEVLALVSQGLSNHEIAEEMDIAATTVKKHVQRILAKLGARDRAHAAVIAVRGGLAP